MATPRKLLVDSERPLCYHLVSRCVRRAQLCGYQDGQSYEHRRAWIEQRILWLGEVFAVDVLAYAVMPNHFHIVVFFDPTACTRWSDNEVIDRWMRAFPPVDNTEDAARQRLEDDALGIEQRRRCLGSLSGFMKHLKQPIAVRVNREDEVKGHLFEQRFYSGALLDDQAVIAAMRYVDLNPFRARIAETLETSDHTSVQRRLRELEHSAEQLDAYLEPLVAGTSSSNAAQEPPAQRAGTPRLRLRDYIRLLRETMASATAPALSPTRGLQAEGWATSVRLFRKRQRAYGRPESLTRWLAQRQMRCLERALL